MVIEFINKYFLYTRYVVYLRFVLFVCICKYKGLCSCMQVPEYMVFFLFIG